MKIVTKNLLGNLYFLVTVVFFLWMLFFDSNDLVSIYALRSNVSDLEAQKEYYIEKIEEVKHEREELFSNPEQLEKFARERYLMKKANEDLYIIQEN